MFLFSSIPSSILPVMVLLTVSTLTLTDSGSDTKSAVIHVTPSNSINTGFTEEEYRKVYSFTKNCKALQHLSLDGIKERIANLTKWEYPAYVKDNFPYYLAGYDYNRRPVWVFEAGKVDFRSVIEKGEKGIEHATYYVYLATFNILKSLGTMNMDEEDEVRHALIIFDMEGASLRQVNYLPSWTLFGTLISDYWDLTIQFVGGVILLNANYLGKLAVDIARPIIGALLERVEVYGSGKSTYLPKLLKHMPIEVIPPWYGGSNKDYKPLLVYG